MRKDIAFDLAKRMLRAKCHPDAIADVLRREGYGREDIDVDLRRAYESIFREAIRNADGQEAKNNMGVASRVGRHSPPRSQSRVEHARGRGSNRRHEKFSD